MTTIEGLTDPIVPKEEDLLEAALDPDVAKSKKITSKSAKKLQEYLEVMEKENLQELEISEGSFQVKLVRQGAALVSQPLSPSQTPADLSESQDSESSEQKGHPIKSPLAGIFYQSSSPTTSPFVQEGDSIAPGQVVCIVEAMKVMNEITADKGGRVLRILVENGKSVVQDQVLLLIDPIK